MDGARSPMSRGKRIRYQLEYGIARVLVCLIQIVPVGWYAGLARRFAWLANDVLRLRDRVTQENLRNVFPDHSDVERQAISRGMWEHLFLMLCEIAVAPRYIHDTNWRDYVYIRDRDLMTSYFLAWRPTVMVSGHFGNFELAVFVSGILGIPTYAIARPLDNPYLHQWLREFRESRGQFILPATGSAGSVERVLEAGGMLSLLGDQHAGTRGCWIDFMGRPASCHKAVALFTLTQQAPMLVTGTVRRNRPLHFEILCEGVADPNNLPAEIAGVRPLTQWYNEHLESMVRRDPEQYWWLHRRWKEKPIRKRLKGPTPADATPRTSSPAADGSERSRVA